MDTQKGVKYFNILIHFSFTYAVLQSAHPASSMDGKPWSSCSSSAPGSWSRNRGWLPGHGSHTWPSRALVRRQRGCKMTLPRKYMEKNCRSGLDVTSSTDSMTSTHDFHALMCIYRHSNMFTLSLSLCRQFCNPMLPMLPNHFESSVQEAKGSWRLCESQQTSTTTWVCRMRGFEGLGQWYHLTGDYSMYMYPPWN